jgi:hypothetical protein
MTVLVIMQAVLNQGDQGENLIPPSLILIPDIPDVTLISLTRRYPQWVPSGAWLPDIRDP